MDIKLRKLLLFLLVFLVAGCSVIDINSNDYLKNVKNIISRNSKYTSKNAIGYQYDLPNGVSVVEVNDFNQKLRSDNSTYYLYADVVSYYYKTYKEYEIDEKAFISSKLETKNKSGYVEVNKHGNKYYVEMMLNYAKMEGYIAKDDLKDTLNNMAYILSSIKYNDDIIVNLLGDEKYNLSENEIYNIFETKKTNSDNFLKYDNQYGSTKKEEAEDLIEKKEIKQEDN